MTEKTNFPPRQEIADKLLKLRSDGLITEAIGLCKEASTKFPLDYFYPKVAGDLCFQSGAYEEASKLFLEFLKKIPNNESLVGGFAKRYYRLRRVWPAEKIIGYATLIMEEIKRGCLKPQNAARVESFIKSDLPEETTIGIEGKTFIDLLKDDRNFNRLAKQEKILEASNPKELEFLLDQYVLNRNRSSSYFRIDAYCVSLYEKKEKNEKAIKIAEELLSIHLDPIVIRSIFRICRKIGNYERVERLLGKYHVILKSGEFNVLYELVYYFENQNNFDAVRATLFKIEKGNASSLAIQKTLRNFYLRFGLLEEASRVDGTIRKLYTGKPRPDERFLGEIQETEIEVGSKIKELYSELEHKTRLAAISDLTTGISHELGQPITNIRYAIQFYSKMFEKRLEKDEVLKVFASILEETERMGALINRLSPLTSSKSVTEKFDLIERIKKRVESEGLRLRRQRISVDIFPRTPIYMDGDPVKFDQIISNLLLNAIDGIVERKSLRSNRIDIKLHEDENDIKIVFSDDGVGIPAKNRGKVFDPFFTTKPPGKGEGLGLFIVWNILKMYGGKILIDPTFIKGTRFLITIPKKADLER